MDWSFDTLQTPVVQHVVTACKPVYHTVTKTVPQLIGVHTMTAVILTVVAALVAGALGYFIGKRGLTGTKTDLTNAETQVKKVVTEATTAAHAAEASVAPVTN